MANTSSAKKAMRQAIKRNLVNKSRKNRIRSFFRKVEDAIKAGNEAQAREAYKALEPELMRGVTKKVMTLNTASRKLRRLADRIRKLQNA